jgi:hypothetical protein
MSLVDRLAQDLTAAMKAQDAGRVSALRMAKAAVKNREIDRHGALDDGEVVKLLQGLVKQREESIEQFRRGGRDDLARKEQAEIDVLRAYLPQGASDDEIAAAVEKAVAETAAASTKDLGKVMKAALAALGATGKTVDGRKVNEVARRRLGG